MEHIIDAEGVRSWVDDDDGKLFASDGKKKFYVHWRLYGDPRFVVKLDGAAKYDGYDLADAIAAYNDN